MLRDGALFRHVSLNLLLPKLDAPKKGGAPENGGRIRGREKENAMLRGRVRVGRGASVSSSPKHISRQLAVLVNAYARSRVWDEVLFHRVSQTVRALQARDIPTKVKLNHKTKLNHYTCRQETFPQRTSQRSSTHLRVLQRARSVV